MPPLRQLFLLLGAQAPGAQDCAQHMPVWLTFRIETSQIESHRLMLEVMTRVVPVVMTLSVTA